MLTRRARPFGSLERLVRSLSPGQVGCLMPGRYRHRGVVRLERARTTIRSVGRPRATIDGAVWVLPAARGARIAGLRLTSHDFEFAIPLKIQADEVELVGNDITASRSISCVLVGSSRPVSGLLIEDNRIHHCGRTGKKDHLIYMAHSRNAVIRRNLLVENPGGWAVHLYPNADGTLVEGNVIDSNHGGVIFAGSGGGETSDGNLVRANVITNSSSIAKPSNATCVRWGLPGLVLAPISATPSAITSAISTIATRAATTPRRRLGIRVSLTGLPAARAYDAALGHAAAIPR